MFILVEGYVDTKSASAACPAKGVEQPSARKGHVVVVGDGISSGIG